MDVRRDQRKQIMRLSVYKQEGWFYVPFHLNPWVGKYYGTLPSKELSHCVLSLSEEVQMLAICCFPSTNHLLCSFLVSGQMPPWWSTVDPMGCRWLGCY